MNKLKFLLLFTVFLLPLGCGEDGKATVDVVKKRIANQIQDMVGKGDIAIQKYDNKIIEVKNKLIKVKVSYKTFEKQVQAKKASLAKLENSGGSEARINLVKKTIQEMETFLQQLQVAETKLLETLQKMKENRELMVLKVKSLEAKRDMLDAIRTVQEYSSIETDVGNIGGNIDNTIEEMQKEIYAIEAEIEIENVLNQAEKLQAEESVPE
jgi:phage shock protein A